MSLSVRKIDGIGINNRSLRTNNGASKSAQNISDVSYRGLPSQKALTFFDMAPLILSVLGSVGIGILNSVLSENEDIKKFEKQQDEKINLNSVKEIVQDKKISAVSSDIETLIENVKKANCTDLLRMSRELMAERTIQTGDQEVLKNLADKNYNLTYPGTEEVISIMRKWDKDIDATDAGNNELKNYFFQNLPEDVQQSAVKTLVYNRIDRDDLIKVKDILYHELDQLKYFEYENNINISEIYKEFEDFINKQPNDKKSDECLGINTIYNYKIFIVHREMSKRFKILKDSYNAAFNK